MYNDVALALPVEGDLSSVKSQSVRMADWFEIAQAPNSPYKALFIGQGNPIHQQPDRQRWRTATTPIRRVLTRKR